MNRIASIIGSTILMSSAGMFPVQATSIGSTGHFSTLHKVTTGTATLIQQENRTYIEFSPDFTTGSDCPDLKVILYRESTLPLHVKEKTHFDIGVIKTFNGTQRYEIPSDVDLASIHSVGLWCEEFDFVFGYATLD